MSEKHIGSFEQKHEVINEAAAERAAELQRKLEKHTTNEKDQKDQLEKAREEATKEALFSRETSAESKQTPEETSEPVVTSKQRDLTYKHTMQGVQEELSPPSRVFSKIIHNPVVEQSSEVIGKTIVRPNSILFGGIFAFIGVAGLYMFARFAGFALTGFETIAAFIIGWIFGLLFDFFRIMITGKQQ